MIGLVMKDFYIQRKTMRTYIALIAFYSLLSIGDHLPMSIVTGVGAAFGILVPINSFAYDNYVKWKTFAAITPNGRRNIVFGKYLFTVLMAVMGTILSTLFLVGLSVLGLNGMEVLDIVSASVMGMVSWLLLASVMIPIIIKVGVEKSRIVFFLFAMTAILGGTLLAMHIRKAGIQLPGLTSGTVAAILLGYAGVTVLVTAGSIFLSLRFYQTKEF